MDSTLAKGTVERVAVSLVIMQCGNSFFKGKCPGVGVHIHVGRTSRFLITKAVEDRIGTESISAIS